MGKDAAQIKRPANRARRAAPGGLKAQAKEIAERVDNERKPERPGKRPAGRKDPGPVATLGRDFFAANRR